MMDGGGRRRTAARSRIWTGVITLAVGCFLVGDTVRRGRAVLDAVAEWWPWALLALALFNLLRSAVSLDSLIGPAVLGSAALCGLALSRGLDTRTVQDLMIPLALAGCGAVLLVTAGGDGRRTRWTRFLSTGRIHVPAKSGELLVFRAVCGELRADLRAARTDGPRTVHITAVAGHVHLIVPVSWQVKVHASGALLTRVTENGRQDERLATGPVPASEKEHEMALHLLGVCGAVSIAHG